MKRYQQVADYINGQINDLQLRPGNLLPSLRSLSQQLDVSKNTVIRAYMLLEDKGLIEPRSRSGFIVTRRPINETANQQPEPREVKLGATSLQVVAAAADHNRIPLGSAHPAIQFPACRDFYKQVARDAYRSANSNKPNSHYIQPPGLPELRRQLARRFDTSISADDIIITNGAQEGVSLALLAVAQAGDIIVVETPCFYGNLQCIEALGMKVLEIPTCASEGIDLELLETNLQQWPIKAMLLNPSHNNPLGFCMPLQRRKKLLKLANKHTLPIIEDDTFGELYFEDRPATLKSLDSEDQVIYCSSLSKTLHSDIRLGWVATGRYFDKINYLKYVTTMASPGLLQQSTARFLDDNRYERHLRTVRRTYRQRYELLQEAIYQYWPTEISLSNPQGGYLSWISLQPHIDCDRIFQQAHQHKINITPGSLFASDERFKHCLRLNFAAFQAEPRYSQAIQTLGELIRQQMP